jgi:hypothetical protein
MRIEREEEKRKKKESYKSDQYKWSIESISHITSDSLQSMEWLVAAILQQRQ